MPYRKTLTIPLEFVTKGEILQRINKNANFVLLDTIGTYEGNKFKIKGAKTIPFPEVIDRRGELAPYDETIVYCRNKKCPASKIAAMGLKLQKVPNVKVYEGGIEEWMEHDLPVEEESE
jgi:rhodanese-related sulfurtransferase